MQALFPIIYLYCYSNHIDFRDSGMQPSSKSYASKFNGKDGGSR